MHRVPTSKQNEVARPEIECANWFGAVEYAGNPFKGHVSAIGIAHRRDVLEIGVTTW